MTMKLDRGAPARDKVLFLLKSRGPQTPTQIARRLGITEVAVRQHLRRLQDEALVEGIEERRGVGRPARVFGTTPAAAARFPNTHADLSVELIAAVRAAFGDDGLDKLLAERTRRQLRFYRSRIGNQTGLEARVAALARIRAEEGYMASWSKLPDGAYLLVENHCPICIAARACQGLCRDELTVFRRLLGSGVDVSRTEHVLGGARRCAYRIVPG
jgi:predicted ArsR family transcriptional regulator